jgi:hypothetical protein
MLRAFRPETGEEPAWFFDLLRVISSEGRRRTTPFSRTRRVLRPVSSYGDEAEYVWKIFLSLRRRVENQPSEKTVFSEIKELFSYYQQHCSSPEQG